MLPNLTIEPTTNTPQFDGIVELPRVVPSREVPQTVHKGLVVGTGLGASHSRYADAYHEAGPGETVQVKNDFVTDESFQLVDKGSDPGWIAFEPVTEIVPPGTRVTPAMLAHLPTLLVPDAGGSISCAPGAHHIRLSGIQIKPSAVKQGYQFVTLAAPGPETATSQPHDIMFDRMALLADPVGQQEFFRRGIYHVMRGLALIDSWLVGFADANNQDSQAVALSGGDGQTLIYNSTLAALSENFLAGGSDHPYQPGDLTFIGNHVWKDPAWLPFGSSSKNLFELKSMVRALVERNLFEQMFPGAQYQAIVLKSVDQDGTMPFAGTRDITFRRNVLRKICAGFSIAANPESYKPCMPLARVSVHHNLLTGVNVPGDFAQAPGFPAFFFNVGGSIDGLSIRQNIGATPGPMRLLQLGEDGDRYTNLHVDDNVLSGGAGSATMVGQGTGYVGDLWAKFVDPATSSLTGNVLRADDQYGPRPTAEQVAANRFLVQSDPEPTYDAADILAAVDGVDAGVPTAPAPLPIIPGPPAPAPAPAPVPPSGGDPMVSLRTALARLLHLFADGTVIDTTKATAALQTLVTNVTDLADAAKKKADGGSPADQAAIDEFTAAIGQANDAILHIKEILGT